MTVGRVNPRLLMERRKYSVENEVHAKNHEIEPHHPENDCVPSIESGPEKDDGANSSPDDVAVSRGHVSIYRVPVYLRDPSHLKAYTPQDVSLGPYHHGRPGLEKWEQLKRQVLENVLKRTGKSKKNFIDSMIALEDRARASYEEHSCLSSDQFVEMMLLDGCFILEIFQAYAADDEEFKNLGYATDEPIFTRLASLIIHLDMIMLENQIPLFVLDKLLQLEYPDGKRNVVELAVGFFGSFLMPSFKRTDLEERKTVLSGKLMPTREQENNSVSDQRGIHFLNLFRESFLYGGPEGIVVEYEKREQLNYCATELRDAGVRFKKGNTDRLWNIEFKNGVLYIPPIMIDRKFKLVFFNLIAFEQCHLGRDQQHITSYVAFLDNLIDSPEDVRYLKSCGIIQHFRGSDAEVADIINCFCHETLLILEDSYLSHLSWQINRHRNQTWNIWRATLKQKYFTNPWAIISFVAAVLLLLMTTAQTFYGVYGYYLPNN